MANTYIDLKKLVYNTGQIEGVPRNPRKWTKEDVTALAASIVETPELFEARPLLVVPRGDRYIVIGGNMRLAAARELAMSAPPCYEIDDRSTENLKRMALKDNASFGEWDTVALADEWPDCPLAEWGIVLPPAPVEEHGEEGPDKYGEDFSLPSGERQGFRQISFMLSDEQVDIIYTALKEAKSAPGFVSAESYGNENKNGKAITFIVQQWTELRK